MSQITIPPYRGFKFVIIFESDIKTILIVYRNNEDVTRRFFNYDPTIDDLFGLKEKIDEIMDRGRKWQQSVDSSLNMIRRSVSNASLAQYIALTGSVPH